MSRNKMRRRRRETRKVLLENRRRTAALRKSRVDHPLPEIDIGSSDGCLIYFSPQRRASKESENRFMVNFLRNIYRS